MSEGEFQSESSEPSEAELRMMLDEREREKDVARQQTSRRFTRILVGSVVVLAGAVFFFPVKPVAVGPAPIAKAVIATASPTPLKPDSANSDPAMDHDLKPFTPQPGAGGGNKEDILFAAQLMNYLRPGDSHAPTPPTKVPTTKKP